MPGDPDVRRAVVDRVADGVAVLLVGPDEKEHRTPAEALPAGAGEGAWLLVAGAGSALRIVGRDPGGEAARRRDVSERMARVRRDRRGGRFRPRR